MGRHGFFDREQIATRFGLAPARIDLYASKGLLIPIRLHDGVFFTSGDFIRLEVIEKGRRLGFSLGEIKRLIDDAKRPD